MRIVAVHEQTIELASAARNASISFDAHDGERARGAHRCDEERKAARSAWPSTRSAATATADCCASASSRDCSAPIPGPMPTSAAASIRTRPGRADDEREARRPWRAMRRGRPARCGAVGPRRQAARTSRFGDLLARHHGQEAVDATIAIYASGGHYRRITTISKACATTCAGRSAQGHRRFKIKIGGEDARRRSAADRSGPWLCSSAA